MRSRWRAERAKDERHQHHGDQEHDARGHAERGGIAGELGDQRSVGRADAGLDTNMPPRSNDDRRDLPTSPSPMVSKVYWRSPAQLHAHLHGADDDPAMMLMKVISNEAMASPRTGGAVHGASASSASCDGRLRSLDQSGGNQRQSPSACRAWHRVEARGDFRDAARTLVMTMKLTIMIEKTITPMMKLPRVTKLPNASMT